MFRDWRGRCLTYFNVLSLHLTNMGDVRYEKMSVGIVHVRDETWAADLRSTKQYITTFCPPVRPITHPFMHSRTHTHAQILSRTLSRFSATDVYLSIYLSIWLSFCLSVYGSTVLLLDLGSFFSSLILYTFGTTPWAGDQLIARTNVYHSRVYSNSQPHFVEMQSRITMFIIVSLEVVAENLMMWKDFYAHLRTKSWRYFWEWIYSFMHWPRYQMKVSSISSIFGLVTPWERATGTHWIGGWVNTEPSGHWGEEGNSPTARVRALILLLSTHDLVTILIEPTRLTSLNSSVGNCVTEPRSKLKVTLWTPRNVNLLLGNENPGEPLVFA
jgi:hypothetical protein